MGKSEILIKTIEYNETHAIMIFFDLELNKLIIKNWEIEWV